MLIDMIFVYIIPLPPTKLQKFTQIRKNICIFPKKAVRLHPNSAMSADSLPLWLSW